MQIDCILTAIALAIVIHINAFIFIFLLRCGTLQILYWPDQEGMKAGTELVDYMNLVNLPSLLYRFNHEI